MLYHSNLLAFMERMRTSPDEKVVLRIFRNIVSALELLHINGVSHRDIKLENVLEGNDGEWKICDFGSATGKSFVVTGENRH